MKYLINIEDSIKDILLTPLGSRVMRPEYGSRLFELVDKRPDDEYKAKLTCYVVEAIHKNEPRVRVKRLKFESLVNHKLTYKIELTNGELINVA